MTTKLNRYLFVGSELQRGTPAACPATGADLADAAVNLVASTQLVHLPDYAAAAAARLLIAKQYENNDWGVEDFRARGLLVTPPGNTSYLYKTATEAPEARVHPGHVHYFEETRSVYLKSRPVARHSDAYGWTNLVDANDNPLHLHTLNSYYFDDRRGGPPGEEVAHKLSFILNPKPPGTSRALPRREAMSIAAEAAEGQLDGYYDEQTGEPVVDHSDPCRDLHAVFVVETVYHTHWSHGDREYNLAALAAAFRRAGDEFEVYAAAFEAGQAADARAPRK